MSWLPLQTVAQISIERILNALPEGFLIALFAWAVLRVLRRQNSGTRFAVWFLALLTVAALPVLGGFGEERADADDGRDVIGQSRGEDTARDHHPRSWALFVFLAWVLGAGVAMLRLVAGLWRLRQLAPELHGNCRGRIFDPAVRKTVDAIGASRSVASRLGNHYYVRVLCACLPPSVLEADNCSARMGVARTATRRSQRHPAARIRAPAALG